MKLLVWQLELGNTPEVAAYTKPAAAACTELHVAAAAAAEPADSKLTSGPVDWQQASVKKKYIVHIQ